MSKQIIGFIFSLFFTFAATTGYSQKSAIQSNINVGIGLPLLDNGTSYHIGMNPFYRISPHFSLEGQLSFAAARITGTFLTGKQKTEYTINGLVGPRLFLTKEDKTFRPYLNFLIGLTYSEERGDVVSTSSTDFPGYSLGAFANVNKVLLGVSLDSPGNLLFKVGYIF